MTDENEKRALKAEEVAAIQVLNAANDFGRFMARLITLTSDQSEITTEDGETIMSYVNGLRDDLVVAMNASAIDASIIQRWKERAELAEKRVDAYQKCPSCGGSDRADRLYRTKLRGKPHALPTEKNYCRDVWHTDNSHTALLADNAQLRKAIEKHIDAWNANETYQNIEDAEVFVGLDTYEQLVKSIGDLCNALAASGRAEGEG